MAFTYDATLSTDLSKVRFHIDDTTSGSGPMPSGGNFTDAELTYLLTGGSVAIAVSDAMGAIAARWSGYSNITVGPRREEYSQVAQAWERRKTSWDDTHSVHIVTTGTVAYVTRVDGYSDDIDAGDV